MEHKRLIAFSLWGQSKLYCQGAIENVLLASKIYPGWTCRFYIAEDCPALPVLQKMDCELVVMPPLEGVFRTNDNWVKRPEHIGMFWRFYAMSEPNIERVIFRDADSRLNIREKAAVDEWIQSGLLCHRMHEKDLHWNSQIMGGLWGIKGGVVSNIQQLIDNFIKVFPTYQEPWIFVDLIFVRDWLWPFLSKSCIGHGLHHDRPFPPHEPCDMFVGQVMNEEWRNEVFTA